MEIALISTSQNDLCLGLRCISSVLQKKEGCVVKKIFLRCPDRFADAPFSEIEMDDLAHLCGGAGLIGFSLMTIDLKPTDFVAASLKKRLPESVIVYGGMHAILRPEACLPGADIVCISEGEEAIVQLVDQMDAGEDVTEVEGFWHKKNGAVIRRKVAPLVADLDAFPAPDFSLDGSYILSEKGLRPANFEMMRESSAFGSHIRSRDQPTHGYVLQTSRGCPHRCTYCSNTQYLKAFRGTGKPYRVRDLSRVLEEIKAARRMYPFLNFINFYDDDFLIRGRDELERFLSRFRTEIGLPFCCMVSPRSASTDKLELIADAGAVQIQMGIQSGSQRILKEIYKRPGSRNDVIKALATVAPFTGRLKTRYDFIFDNPYEEREDFLTTLELIQHIPKPYRLQVFSLVVFQETELHGMLERDGLMSEDLLGDRKVMSLYGSLDRNTYYKFLVISSPFIGKWFFRVLRSSPVFTLLNQPVFDRLFAYLVLGMYRVATRLGVTGTRF